MRIDNNIWNIWFEDSHTDLWAVDYCRYYNDDPTVRNYIKSPLSATIYCKEIGKLYGKEIEQRILYLSSKLDSNIKVNVT